MNSSGESSVDPGNTGGVSGEPRVRRGQFNDLVLAICGYLLLMASVFSFGVIVFMKFLESRIGEMVRYEAWLDFLQHESSTLSLLLIGIVTATLEKRILTTVQLAGARTIPIEDLHLVERAVIDGKSDPIDQYVRLRSLSGVSGNFTKLGITGLPLTTVFLTLVFSVISLFPFERAESFLDLAKLTLGAFIGSFVQRQVEQRRQEAGQ